MKNTQVIQLMSIVRLSIFMLGITMMSCNSKKEQQLPAIGKSVALFDYFSYKGNDDFFSNIIECNIGRNCSSDLNNNKREHKREYNVIFHNIKNHILVYNSHFINSV